jgi:hypothetical protein
MRTWIECGFKDTKRGGLHWHCTKMQDPTRAERHWLVMAVATLWAISVGGQSDAAQCASTLDALPPTHSARRLSKHRDKPRKLSCFARGLMILTIALLQGGSLPMGQFVPFSWPSVPPQALQKGDIQGAKKKTYP